MATITPTPLAGDFNAALFNFLKTPGIEGFEPFVYNDSVGIPTLGVGYALVIQNSSTGKWEVRNGYQAELSASISTISQAQLDVLGLKLQSAAKRLNGDTTATNPFPTYSPKTPLTANDNILDWSMTEQIKGVTH